MTYVQPQIDFTGADLRDAGIKTAVDHADAVSEKWSENAYQLLIKFLQSNKRFMCEDFRSYAAELDFDLPPSGRAFGGVIMRAAREFIIIKIGIQSVKNKKAHLANAGVWERNDERMIEHGLL